MACREDFLAITSGWMLIDSVEHITDLLDDVIKWTKLHGPLNEDEEKVVKLMISVQIAKGIARGGFADCGIFPKTGVKDGKSNY